VRKRDYAFNSEWVIPAPRKKVWQVLTATPFSWEQWWPQLTKLHVTKITPEYIGTTFNCTFRATSGYRLHATFRVTVSTEPSHITFESTGDLLGTADWQFTETDGLTHIDIVWKVSTTKWWMNSFGPLLRPLFVSNHNVLMNSGEEGLRNFIRDN
jgi:hypothetical protein